MDDLPDLPFTKSCYVYGHEAPCATMVEHLRRLHAERAAAGGEAALKAKVGYWDRFAACGRILAERRQA